MEFVCIEAKTFMEMNEALEAVAKKMCETCGSCVSGMVYYKRQDIIRFMENNIHQVTPKVQ